MIDAPYKIKLSISDDITRKHKSEYVSVGLYTTSRALFNVFPKTFDLSVQFSDSSFRALPAVDGPVDHVAQLLIVAEGTVEDSAGRVAAAVMDLYGNFYKGNKIY